jgi:hypothetical protein
MADMTQVLGLDGLPQDPNTPVVTTLTPTAPPPPPIDSPSGPTPVIPNNAILDLGGNVVGTASEVTQPAATPATAVKPSPQASPQVTGAPASPSVVATPVDPAAPPTENPLIGAAAAIKGVPNGLNAYYNPTYHFRLFAAGDTDIFAQSDNSIPNISNVKQVTVVESGVTGASIKEVVMHTVSANTAITKAQNLLDVTMTVIDPLGLSFLDGLVDAGQILGLKDYTKAQYFLELTFKGYDENGNPVRPALPNNGLWVWALTIFDIGVKLTEGGGQFTITFKTIGGGSPLDTSNNDEQRIPQQTLTVSGTTIKELFQDFSTKLNHAWANNYGGSTGNALVKTAIVTHPIAIGPTTALGKDPGSFVLKSKTPYQSTQRTWQFDAGDNGKVTCQIPPDTSVSEFITAAIYSTEEGQALLKDEPVISKIDASKTRSNNKGYRETVAFAVETDIKFNGFDTDSNNYIKQVTFHVVAHFAQHVILSTAQLEQAKTLAVQNQMLQSLISKGLIQKRYDYIFTGLNTEVIDLNMEWNFSWSTIVPKLAGGRAGYGNASVNAVQSPNVTKPQYNRPEDLLLFKDTANPTLVPTSADTPSSLTALPGLGVVPSAASTSGLTSGSTGSGSVTSPSGLTGASTGSGLTSLTIPSINSNPVSTATGVAIQSLAGSSGLLLSQSDQLVSQIAGVAKLPGTSSVAQVSSGAKNTYVEDVIDQRNQALPIPISLRHGNNDTAQESGKTIVSGQYHRDQSVIGAVISQIYGELDGTGAKKPSWLTVELGIRGDPFWLGQTNLDRKLVLEDASKPTFDATKSPDFYSAKFIAYLYFRYPLGVGDDFVPILKSNEVFSGLYQVRDVTHTFSDGAFKQTLTMDRLNLLGTTTIDATPTTSNPTPGPTSPTLSLTPAPSSLTALPGLGLSPASTNSGLTIPTIGL